MLIPLPELLRKYNVKVRGVIQVGSHWAEEHNVFMELGIKNMVYIEPCREAFCELWNRFFFNGDGITLFHVACADYEGESEMFTSHNNQGQSNSLLKPLLHIHQHPEVVFNETEKVKVTLLDNLGLDMSKYNLLMMDVQGAEGLVLKGATETLKHIDMIYTECNRDFTYENNILIEEMDAFLEPFGFKRVETYWPSLSWSWGDAIFISEKLL